MRSSAAILAALAIGSVSACTTLSSGESQSRTIVVDGEAKIQVKPDMFALSSVFASQNSDQGITLSDLSAKLERVRQTLPRLEGLTYIEIDSSNLTIGPVYDLACVRANDYDSPQLCPVTGRSGTVELTIKASPAHRAGQLVSLLSELGAQSVDVNSFYISDTKSARDQAVAAAVEHARSKATAIANAAGTAIGGVDRVQYGNGFGSDGGRDVVVVTANMRENFDPQVSVTPAVNLNIDPPPISISAKVTVSFGLKD